MAFFCCCFFSKHLLLEGRHTQGRDENACVARGTIKIPNGSLMAGYKKGCDINLKMYSNEVPFMIQITNFVTDEFLKDS